MEAGLLNDYNGKKPEKGHKWTLAAVGGIGKM